MTGTCATAVLVVLFKTPSSTHSSQAHHRAPAGVATAQASRTGDNCAGATRRRPAGTLPFDQTPAGGDWPEMDQAAGQDDGWD